MIFVTETEILEIGTEQKSSLDIQIQLAMKFSIKRIN